MVYAMAGGSDVHNTIAGNLFAELRSRLGGGPCRVFFADEKAHLFIAKRDVFYYPDVMVTCDSRDSDPYSKRFPKVIIEELSESTEGTDRREKFWNYMQVDSMEEYLLVAQDKIEVTVFRRETDWHAEVLNATEQEIRLSSLKVTIPVSTVFDGVQFNPSVQETARAR